MIVYILVTILALVIALLFIPFDFYGRGQITEDIRLEWGLAWAGGLVLVRWNLPVAERSGAEVRVGPWVKNQAGRQSSIQDISQPRIAASQEQPKSKKPKKPSSHKVNWDVLRAVLDKQAWKEVLAFLSRLWHSLRLRCDLEGDYGTDDPAFTAWIAALITLINQNGQQCHLYPRFTETGVNLNGSIQGQLRPGLIIWDAGRFILKRPIRKIWWTLLREGKKQR